MNILAEKQKSIYEKGIDAAERERRNKEFMEIYYKARLKSEKRFYNKFTLEQREKLHGLVLLAYAIQNSYMGFTYKVVSDEHQYTDKPIIFAVSHIGKYDIQMVSEAIRKPYYLLSGDYEHIQGTVDSFFLSFNGVIYFNEKVKEDRNAVVGKMINHLQSGGNLMYFPEGTWNLSPNLPMLPCYWGIIDIARRSGADIIPIAVEQYGKNFKISIGKNFDVNKYEIEDKLSAINDLRDTLATLKWEIWETEPLQVRCKLDGNEWSDYITERLSEWPYFNEEYIGGLIYKPKNVIEYEEAFAFLQDLTPTLKNAFLFKTRQHIEELRAAREE